MLAHAGPAGADAWPVGAGRGRTAGTAGRTGTTDQAATGSGAGPGAGAPGQPDAPLARLAVAARHAATADVLKWLVPTGLAHIEQAWLTGDHRQAGPYPGLLLERTDRRGMLLQRGELLLYLRRLGYPATGFDGCRNRPAALRRRLAVGGCGLARRGRPVPARTLALAESTRSSSLLRR